MAQDSYTFGTTPRDVLEDRLPHKYEMALTRGDMLSVLDALALAAGGDENAMSLRAGILSTLDIEEI
jgi:hypothetical protein